MQRGTPTTAAPLGSDAAQHEAVLVYHPGQFPTWLETDEPGRQQVPATAAVTNTTYAAYAPFASVLNATPPNILSEIARRLAALDREGVIRRYRAAYANGKWLVAYLMAAN
jgi:hypothetical protein